MLPSPKARFGLSDRCPTYIGHLRAAGSKHNQPEAGGEAQGKTHRLA